MNNENNERPKFPTNPDTPVRPIYEPDDYTGKIIYGMTKREYFAAAAMQGLASKDYAHLGAVDAEEISRAISSTSVQLADALIVELNKEK